MPKKLIDPTSLPVRDLWLHDDNCAGRPVRAVLVEDIDKAEDAEAPRWIPVSDPPKETGHYLVSLHRENPEGDLNDIVLDAWFQKEVFLFTSSEAGWHLLNEFYDLTPQLREYITHWMPMPEPAEVE